MEQMELRILGCASAKPNKRHNPSSQLLSYRGKQYMIDCGEGTQLQLARYDVRTNRLGHIFISHLHGDHLLGLMGFIMSQGLLARTATLYIHSAPELEKILREEINFFCQGLSYDVVFEPFSPYQHACIFEDKSMRVKTIPLKHRVPSCGFLFEEKATRPHILRDMIDFYQIPYSEIDNIKNGKDFVLPTGEVISHTKLTTPSAKPKSFAYCSDTAYNEKIVPLIEGVDCLFHEATFMKDNEGRASETLHSTAEQAATIAKKAQVNQLIIGHYSARYKTMEGFLAEAQAIFPNTHLADEGKSFLF